MPCDDEAQAKVYRELLCDLVLGYSGESARLLEYPAEPAWNDVHVVPVQLTRCANVLGLVPPSLDQWRALTPAQRFALVKLTRVGHESPNYLTALQEFALI